MIAPVIIQNTFFTEPAMSLSSTVSLARELIRRESVTPADAGCQELLGARLEKIGFTCEAMIFEDVTNLWATRGGGRPLLAFAGHTDVVPTGPLDQWKIPPFQGEVRDGMLHGRGAADMKGSIACFVTACERFVADHPDHAGAIGLLITSDEEGVARWGTGEVMNVLAERKQSIDMCIVGEPSSKQTLGDTIKVGRRGSCGAKLRIKGTQGHIAYPADNPIHRAAAVIGELLSVEWDRGNEHFQPTSFQLSNIHAGTGAGNVVPGAVEIDFNLRYSPEITAADIHARIEEVLARHQCQFEIHWERLCLPFQTTQGKFVDAVSHCIEANTGCAPLRSTGGGTSDGRFIAPTGAEVIELGPLNDTIHQIDERVSTADLDQLSVIYEDILVKMLG